MFVEKQDLIEVFKKYKGFTEMDLSELFTKDSNVKDTRGNTLIVEKPACTGDGRKFFFSHRVVGRWNCLHQ